MTVLYDPEGLPEAWSDVKAVVHVGQEKGGSSGGGMPARRTTT
ncbi:MAG: hypothetical protein U0736_06025 [Gemmataceae bacterium]